MSTITVTRETTAWRELDERETDAGRMRIALLWHAETQRVLVEVDDRATGVQLHIPVLEGQKASQVYAHPYAYESQAWELEPLPRPE